MSEGGDRVRSVEIDIDTAWPADADGVRTLREETALALDELDRRLSEMEKGANAVVAEMPHGCGADASAGSGPGSGPEPSSPAADVDGLARRLCSAWYGSDTSPGPLFDRWDRVKDFVLARENDIRNSLSEADRLRRTAEQTASEALAERDAAEEEIDDLRDRPRLATEGVRTERSTRELGLHEEIDRLRGLLVHQSDYSAQQMRRAEAAEADLAAARKALEAHRAVHGPAFSPQEPTPAEGSAEEELADGLRAFFGSISISRDCAAFLRSRGYPVAREPRVEVRMPRVASDLPTVLLNGVEIMSANTPDCALSFAQKLRAALRGGA